MAASGSGGLGRWSGLWGLRGFRGVWGGLGGFKGFRVFRGGFREGFRGVKVV